MKKFIVLRLLAISLSGGILSACTQLPTEKQGALDLRPQLSFKVANEGLFGARVLIDDLDMGRLGDYAEGSATLRILSGNHTVKVDLNGKSIMQERIYVGDGINRTIFVK